VANRLSRLQSILFELKRRKVFQVASLYVVAAWGASVGAADLLPAFGAPEWAVRAFVISAVLGFPVAVALAWIFEITAGGVVRDDPGEARTGVRKSAAVTSVDPLRASEYVLLRWTDARGTHERRFDRDFTIGRDADCDVHLDDPLISRHHAEIARRDDLWWVRDLGSRNGTLLDGQGIDSQVALPPCCELQLADRGPRLMVEIHAPSHATTLASGHFRQLRSPTLRR